MRVPTHPGEMVVKEFLEPKDMSVDAFVYSMFDSRVSSIDYPSTTLFLSDWRTSETKRWRRILNGKSSLKRYDAFLLANYFNTSERFWINCQNVYDFAKASNRSNRICGILLLVAGIILYSVVFVAFTKALFFTAALNFIASSPMFFFAGYFIELSQNRGRR